MSVCFQVYGNSFYLESFSRLILINHGRITFLALVSEAINSAKSYRKKIFFALGMKI